METYSCSPQYMHWFWSMMKSMEHREWETNFIDIMCTCTNTVGLKQKHLYASFIIYYREKDCDIWMTRDSDMILWLWYWKVTDIWMN